MSPCVYTYYLANFRIDNYDAGAVDVSTLTVRWWFNNASNVNTSAGYYLYIYNSSGVYQGYATITGTQTAMGSSCTLGGRTANRYVDLSFSSISIPAGGYAIPNGNYVQMTLASGAVFDAACDDYSTTTSTGFNEWSHVGLYQSGSLVCEYSDAATLDANTGVEPCSGASGCGAASSPTATPTSAPPSPTRSPTPSRTATPVPGSPTSTPTRTPVLSPTATPTVTRTQTLTVTRTSTPVVSATATLTASPTSAVYQSPTPTRTPAMNMIKSANRSTAMVGDTITYYIDWSNDATAAVTYQIWDSLESYLSYKGCTGGCSSSGQVVSWSFAAGSGASGQVAFWATVVGTP